MPDATSRKDANTDRTGTQYPAGVAPGSRRSIRINRTSSRRLAVTSSGGENPTHTRRAMTHGESGERRRTSQSASVARHPEQDYQRRSFAESKADARANMVPPLWSDTDG